VELLRDLTSSRKELEAALNLLQTPEQESGYGSGPIGGGGQSPGGGNWPGGGGGGGRWPGGPQGRGGGRGRRGPGTTLYDAVLLSSDDLMKKQSGRKAVVILSDGVDNGSKTSLTDAIASAQHSDTLVYSIRFYDDGAYGGGGFGGMGRHGGMGRMPSSMGHADGKAVLERISKQTGATYFEVSKKLSTEDIYTRIEDELRNQYSLGFTPDPPATNGEFRKIELTAKRQGLIVQTREGYYAREA
jgi:VWFA-related protein